MSQSGTHHDKAKYHLRDSVPPEIVESKGVEETRVWRISKLLRSMAYSGLSISQQLLFVAQNTRDIADELHDLTTAVRALGKKA